jgi:hypothetical protein
MIALGLCFFPYICVFAAFDTTRAAFLGLIKFFIENVLMILVSSIIVIFTMFGLSQSIELLYANTEKGSNILSANYAYVLVWALLCTVMMSRANDMVGRIMSMRPGPNHMGAAAAAGTIAGYIPKKALFGAAKGAGRAGLKGMALARKEGARYMQAVAPEKYSNYSNSINSIKAGLYTDKGPNPYADATTAQSKKERSMMIRAQIQQRRSYQPNQALQVEQTEARNSKIQQGLSDAQKSDPGSVGVRSQKGKGVGANDLVRKGAMIRANRWNK